MGKSSFKRLMFLIFGASPVHSGRLWSFIWLPWPTFGGLWWPLVLHLSPLGFHWGAFGGHWGSLWESLCDHFLPKTHFEHFCKFGDFFKVKKRAMKRPKCEKSTIVVGPNRGLKKKDFSPNKRDIDFVCIFVGLNALPQDSFTRLLSQNSNSCNTKRSRTNQS